MKKLLQNACMMGLVLLGIGLSNCTEKKQSVSLPEPERTLLFKPGDAGSKFYRIPALITAADGSLVAIADKRWERMNDLPSHIDVVARRSTDMGKTWSEIITIAGGNTDTGYGDAAIVMDKKTGKLLCIMASGNGLWQSNKDDYQHINICTSSDNGLTWSAPRDITDQIYGPQCADSVRSKWYGAFAASGRALQLRDGRILFVIATRTTPDWGGKLSNYVCYSDDGGETWNVSRNPGDDNGDEAKLVELEDGKLLMSIRNRDKGKRKFSYSTDRGETWSAPVLQADIDEPACNGDIIRYASVTDGDEQNILLHSIPNDSLIRQNVSVLVSYDEGKTWPVRRTLEEKLSAYSSLTVLPDGTIGMLIEEGKWDANLPGEDAFNIWFVRFSLDWLSKQDEAKESVQE